MLSSCLRHLGTCSLCAWERIVLGQLLAVLGGSGKVGRVLLACAALLGAGMLQLLAPCNKHMVGLTVPKIRLKLPILLPVLWKKRTATGKGAGEKPRMEHGGGGRNVGCPAVNPGK